MAAATTRAAATAATAATALADRSRRRASIRAQRTLTERETMSKVKERIACKISGAIALRGCDAVLW
jgi:hypothetical protein